MEGRFAGPGAGWHLQSLTIGNDLAGLPAFRGKSSIDRLMIPEEPDAPAFGVNEDLPVSFESLAALEVPGDVDRLAGSHRALAAQVQSQKSHGSTQLHIQLHLRIRSLFQQRLRELAP